MIPIREHVLAKTGGQVIRPSGNWPKYCNDYIQVKMKLDKHWWDKVMWCRTNVDERDYVWGANGAFVFTHAHDATAFKLRWYDDRDTN